MALNQKSFGDIITFTRASAATRINSLGVIESVSANTPRIDYDPVTLAVRGLLLEEQRTNLLLNSLIDGTPLATQSVTVTAVANTLSFYGSGSIALSGAYTGNLVGAGAYPARNSLTFTPGAGTLTLTVTGDVKFAQCGPGSWATSFIPTAGSQVTRAADVAAINALSPWFNPAAMTFFTEATQGSDYTSSGNCVVNINDGSANNGIYVGQRMGASTVRSGAMDTGGVGNTQFALAHAVASAGIGSTNKVALAISANDAAGCANGGPISADSSVILASGLVAVRLGAIFNGSQPLTGWIRKLRYYPKRVNNDDLQFLSIHGRLPGETA